MPASFRRNVDPAVAQKTIVHSNDIVPPPGRPEVVNVPVRDARTLRILRGLTPRVGPVAVGWKIRTVVSSLAPAGRARYRPQSKVGR